MRHIYNLGLIGNCAFSALIDTQARIQWLCWPRFDSSFVFGGLLDEQKGGCFSVIPSDENYSSKQYYIENTNVLCTEFSCSNGRFRVIDFAPRFSHQERYFKPLMLIRKLEWLEGSPNVSVVCTPRYNYGELIPEIQMGSNHIRYSGFGQEVRLSTNISLNFILEEKSFVLNEPRYLVLTWGIPLEGPIVSTAEDFLSKTISYWRNWAKQCHLGHFAQQQVLRSALTLKMHQYEDTGAIIAATTTSLPESPGSGRTWDYRYCWMRDTFYTLRGLINIGHFHEMEHYARYINNIVVKEDGRYPPVYDLSGGTSFEEVILPLAGYKGNNPVRIGNAAKDHIQNDVYGEILVSMLPLYVDKRFSRHELMYSLPDIGRLLHAIDMTMDESDAGLWEFRNFAQQHAFTFFFHWAGAWAGRRIALELNDTKMAQFAQNLIQKAAERLEMCWDPEIGAYTQAIGSKSMDASLLQLITMNYIDPTSERARSHLKAIEERLMTPNGLFYRYIHQDDFGFPETTFLVCSFWYCEALAAVGRIEDAIRHFEQITQYGNHLGLFSEDVSSLDGSQWGNFPQTYSHVGLMNAAFRISRKVDKPDFLWKH
jgi:GH15 family glucan-1,4-alpha-glucosidase